MPPLVPCPNCQRHVRSTEVSCPFCKTKSRSAAGFLGVALGAALATGCPSSPPPNRAVAEYGAPPPPATATPAPSASASPAPSALEPSPADPDDFRGAAEYGAPPPRRIAPEPDDRERAVPKYGAPPPREPR
jgi:hypothetical protein